MDLRFTFLVILVSCMSSFMCENIGSVLTRVDESSNLIRPISIGSIMNSADFSNHIDARLKNSKNINVISVQDSVLESSLQYVFGQSSDYSKNIEYLPLVQNPNQQIQIFASQNPDKLINFIAVTDFVDIQNYMNDTTTVVIIHEHDEQLSRHKRDAATSSLETNATIEYAYGDQCAAMLDYIYVIDQTAGINNNKIILDISDMKFDCKNSTNLSSLTLTFTNNTAISGKKLQSMLLNFNMDISNQYWLLANGSLTANGLNYALVYMGAPYGMETPGQFSFACTNTRFQLYNASKDTNSYFPINIYIQDFQFQPLNVKINGGNYTFGKVNYCQGFFSSGIFMAITASLLLTFILAFGISMLMNINTMDRFDDPKGKPLNIAIEK